VRQSRERHAQKDRNELNLNLSSLQEPSCHQREKVLLMQMQFLTYLHTMR